MLADRTCPVVQLDVPGVVHPIAVDTLGDIGVITSNKVSVCVLEVPEAFEVPIGKNEHIGLGKARHKHGRCEYEYGQSEEFGEACHQEGGAEETFQEEFGKEHDSSESEEFGTTLFDMSLESE